jgi:hypothetical protein
LVERTRFHKINGMRRLTRSIRKRFRRSRAKGTGLATPALTFANAARFLYQQRLFQRIGPLDGDVVECGVGKGVTLLMWAALCHEEAGQRRIWGFDSFEGFPEPTAEDDSERKPRRGEWNVGTIRDMHKMLVGAGFADLWLRTRVTLVKGFFEESLAKYTGDEIALLHIDADLYESYKTVLEDLYGKVRPGGVIAFDEYMGSFEHHGFPGAKKAVDEFFADKDATIQRDEAFGKYFVVKPGPISTPAGT